jgi:hypothetical protein
MLALTVAGVLHEDDTKDIFRRNHPGGAIGAKARKIEVVEERDVREIRSG